MEAIEQNMSRSAGYLVSEAQGNRSRKQGYVASGAGIVLPATVMGTVTASGEFLPLDPAASTGPEVASAILFQGCDAISVAVRRTFTIRDSEVVEVSLIWPDGITNEQKTAALGQLEAKGIIAR